VTTKVTKAKKTKPRAASFKQGQARLLKLAAILDEAHAQYVKDGKVNSMSYLSDEGYDQTCYVHKCGTPACALGHWAVFNPARWGITKRHMPFLRGVKSADVQEVASQEFALESRSLNDWVDFYQADELFGGEGCGNAMTAKQAATYIRKFVKKRESKHARQQVRK
jgi:hypothetical protein